MTKIIISGRKIEVDTPMREEHFEITLTHMRLTDKDLIEACHRILVGDERNVDVEKDYKIDPSHISRTCQNIIKKWKEVCAENGMIAQEFVLKQNEVEAVGLLEKPNMEVLKKEKKGRNKK